MTRLTPAIIISRIIVLLVAMAVHEYAHAYVSYRMGDTTAKDQGKMALDPRVNIDWRGFAIGVITGYGILGSAPVNAHRMSKPLLGRLLATLAGPVANLLLAVVFAIPFRLFPRLGDIAISSWCSFGQGSFLKCLLHFPAQIMLQMVWLNVVLFVLNLLPFYPLDGWHIVHSILPTRQAVWWERNRQNSTFALIGLAVLSFLAEDLIRFSAALRYLNLVNWLVDSPSAFIMRLLIR